MRNHAHMGTSGLAPSPPTLDVSHPIFRGDFIALVFSGSAELLGDLPGEPTAYTQYKFALADPRSEHGDDFAHGAGAALPQWPTSRITPTDGVCFVFSDSDHPSLEQLSHAGGVEHEHFVVVSDNTSLINFNPLESRLAHFIQSVPVGARIVILGYGHQGAAIAHCLIDQLGVSPDAVVVHDSSGDSVVKATHDGFKAVTDANEAMRIGSAIIYSPRAHYHQLSTIASKGKARGLPCFDNSKRASGLQQFQQSGVDFFDGTAARAIDVKNRLIAAKPHGLALNCAIIREDLRRINGVEFPHLHSGHRCTLRSLRDSQDLSKPPPTDSLSIETWVESRHAYVSVRDRADLGFFAARELCLRLWLTSTEEIFPSEHVVDLGMTAFERLLRNHFDCREIVPTMQTPAQRVTLGVAAKQFADLRPIIEIGSAFGGSALLMAAATEANRPPIISIDPEASTRDIMRFAFEREGFMDRLHQVIEPSDAAISKLTHLKRSAGLVFIDGLHTEAGVRSDLELYADLVAPGGALVFHDVAPLIFPVFKVVMEGMLCDSRFHTQCLVDGLMVFERRDTTV